MWYIRWYLETILVSSRNNRFDAHISQTDKVVFCLGACRLSAENGERASRSKVSDKKLTSENFKIGKNDQLTAKKQKKKKKTASIGG